jgi:hypothetical protein
LISSILNGSSISHHLFSFILSSGFTGFFFCSLGNFISTFFQVYSGWLYFPFIKVINAQLHICSIGLFESNFNCSDVKCLFGSDIIAKYSKLNSVLLSG